jgi:hypothetical protein
MHSLKFYKVTFLSRVTLYPFLFSLALGLFIVSNADAQSKIVPYKEEEIKNRKYLIEHLAFYYVENPNSENSEAYKLDNAAIAEGKREGTFWKTSNSLITKLVEALLCEDNISDKENKGISVRQGNAAEILKILNKPVQVWIYNDTKPLGAYALEKYAPCTDSLGYVLPCAVPFKKDNNQSDLWAGFVHLGIKHTVTDFDAQNSVATLYDSLESFTSIFMHMLAHTQDHSDIDAHASHPCETQRWFKLRQEDHFFVRVMPDRMLAYQEGVALGFSLAIHHYEYWPAHKWFETNGYLLVETLPDSADRDFMDKVWLYDKISKVAGEGDLIPGMPHYRGYKISELPTKFIIQSEIIMGLMLSIMGEAQLREALVKTQAERADPNTSFNPLATLIKYLCEGGLPAGETVLSAFKLPADTPKRYLMPLVYADYYTAFKTQNKAEFSEIFDNELPQPWIDLYWDTMMEKIRKAVPASAYEQEYHFLAENPEGDLFMEIQEVSSRHTLAIIKELHLK